jgi:ACR3 family arsenite efflux pump ArsB
MMKIGLWSIGAVLVMLALLFAFEGEAILKQPLVIALLGCQFSFKCSSIRHWHTG